MLREGKHVDPDADPLNEVVGGDDPGLHEVLGRLGQLDAGGSHQNGHQPEVDHGQEVQRDLVVCRAAHTPSWSSCW